MTSHASTLLLLARRVLDPYIRTLPVACAAVTGSSAEGLSDEFSDLDTTIYYHTMPSREQLAQARAQVGEFTPLWSMGDPADGEYMESYRVPPGVEVQIGHVTVSSWEDQMSRALAGEDPGSPLHKAMSGTLTSIALTGTDHLQRWQARLRDYPQCLRESMVRHHLKFFPVWGLLERMSRRDCRLWIRQSLVDSSFNLLGVLAGLNRKYFTSFQFKRTRAFVDSLAVRPDGFADRLEALWIPELPKAAVELRSLVSETVTLVERELPAIDTAPVRKSLDRRDMPWIGQES